eukprot:GFYU01013913.1.p1 GENE.GFYU01013913.1~~GFYU01013913.1.p1  ORF type:complete len:323 (-),score=65.38 GFYU01013913.1:269-1141(-)
MSKDSHIFSSLPPEPDDQLDVGFRVISHAYRQKVQALEFEVANMKQFTKEKQNQMSGLERRIADLEAELRDAHQRNKELHDANTRMANDKAQLEQTIQRQSRELGRLAMFKKSIMKSINDGDTVDEETAAATYAAASTYTASASIHGYSPSASPALPKSPRARDYLAADMRTSYLNTSATDSTMKMSSVKDYETRPESRASSRAQTPTKLGGEFRSGGLNLVDGKDFFRQARIRLSYDQFNKFLTNIKNLNNHVQSRDETLAKAREIFGAENEDLYTTFRNLLSRHGTTT